MSKIFLSASIPLPERDAFYYKSADFIAIRDAVKALTTVVIPQCHLVCGGHPSITPLIRHVIEKMGVQANDHVTIYQSKHFTKKNPKSNLGFKKVIYTPKMNSIEKSLLLMREQMIGGNDLVAGIFIGGMEGILDEYKIFVKHHPEALIIPVASTGAGASELFRNLKEVMNHDINLRLINDYEYMTLFKDLLEDFLRSMNRN